MKLKTHLRASSLEQLTEIAGFWDLSPADEAVAADPATLADYLYPRMQTPTHFRVAFDKLDAAQREWVYLLALHGGELPVDEFRKRTGFPNATAMQEAVDRLATRGFVWREHIRDALIRLDVIGLPEPFVRLIELPPYWQGFLGQHLHRLGIEELRAIARNTLGERPQTRKKQALLHYVRKKLLDPEQLQQFLQRRDPVQIEMFQHILQRNGMCAWKDLLDAGLQKKFDHHRAERLRELVEQSGLVFVVQETENKYNNLLMVPRDLAFIIQKGYRRDQRSLGELSHAGDRPQRGEPAGHPGVILDNSNNVLRDLTIICAMIQREPIRMLNNGGLGRNDLKKIAPLLSHNKTSRYISFLALFAIVRKLLIPVGDQWRVSGSLTQWLEGGQQCMRELYEFWLGTSDWNEEYIDGDVVHADTYPQNLISITELRKLVLRMMEKLPADTWIDFETFAESLLPQIAIEIPGRFDLTPTDKFNRHPVLIVEAVIAETLYWLGVVALGVSSLDVARKLGSRPNESIAPYDPNHPVSSRLMGDGEFMFVFRPTDFGRTLLSRPYLDPDKLFARIPDEALPQATRSLEITVQPNQEIVTPPDFDLPRFFRLLQFTDIKKVDVMTTLTIAHDSVRAGLDHGLKGEDMLRLLEECSRRELPETVRQMIGECESRHGEVDLSPCGAFIRVTDRMRFEEIKANPKIAPAIKDTFDDRYIVLSRTADMKKVVRELHRIGYLPHIDSDSLYVTSEGLFQITLRTDELYDLLAVIRFAIMLEEENKATVFEGRVRPLFERLSSNAQERFNPNFYAESIARGFYGHFEKLLKKLTNESTRKLRKQLDRLVSRVPRGKPSDAYKGANPARDPGDVLKMIRFALDHEVQIHIRYQRSSGEVIDPVIEPEAIQDKKLYAFCPDEDEHHIFAIDRIERAHM